MKLNPIKYNDIQKYNTKHIQYNALQFKPIQSDSINYTEQ